MKDILFQRFQPISKHDFYYYLFGLLRLAIFISFYILSIRFIYTQIDHAPIKYPILLIPILLIIAILSLWKTLWCLYGFLIIIPLISGMQMLGFMQAIPMISLIFAAIYLSYLPKRLFFEKGDISPRTIAGSLADILSAVVLLSLIFILIPYPPSVVVDLIWYIPSDMQESLYSIEAAYVVLQGLFFFRMMELEMKNHSPSEIHYPSPICTSINYYFIFNDPTNLPTSRTLPRSWNLCPIWRYPFLRKLHRSSLFCIFRHDVCRAPVA